MSFKDLKLMLPVLVGPIRVGQTVCLLHSWDPKASKKCSCSDGPLQNSDIKAGTGSNSESSLMKLDLYPEFMKRVDMLHLSITCNYDS